MCFLVSSKVRLKKDVFRSTLLIRSICIKVSDLSHFLSLSLSLPLLQTNHQKHAYMELSTADYEEAFHHSLKRNYTGAIYEYCQRQNTSPSFALIPGPIGGERLFTVQLHLNGLRTIGLARTVKAARHRASENLLRSFRACAFVKNLFMSCTIEKKKSWFCMLCTRLRTGSRHQRASNRRPLESRKICFLSFFSIINLILVPLK